MRSIQATQRRQPAPHQAELHRARAGRRSAPGDSRVAVHSLRGHPEGHRPQGPDLRPRPPHQGQARREDPFPLHPLLQRLRDAHHAQRVPQCAPDRGDHTARQAQQAQSPLRADHAVALLKRPGTRHLRAFQRMDTTQQGRHHTVQVVSESKRKSGGPNSPVHPVHVPHLLGEKRKELEFIFLLESGVVSEKCDEHLKYFLSGSITDKIVF